MRQAEQRILGVCHARMLRAERGCSNSRVATVLALTLVAHCLLLVPQYRMASPLEGITVIEAANYVAAPSAGGLMADLGADVIKIEPPGGEVMRGVIPVGTDVP